VILKQIVEMQPTLEPLDVEFSRSGVGSPRPQPEPDRAASAC
jgi:hypothetical protein